MRLLGGQSAGNPAGCVYLPEPDALSGDAMQQIARELGGFVSEVVYVYTDEDVTAPRYFSPEREVAFCGHCTVAVLYDLIKNDPEPETRSSAFMCRGAPFSCETRLLPQIPFLSVLPHCSFFQCAFPSMILLLP